MRDALSSSRRRGSEVTSRCLRVHPIKWMRVADRTHIRTRIHAAYIRVCVCVCVFRVRAYIYIRIHVYTYINAG